jgi:uncharacterized SAM-binding protein YcdF (DUF218 family)
MYFIFSKILFFLLYPFLWVCVLLVISFLTKNTKRKRRLMIAAFVVLYLFSCPILLQLFVNAWNVKNELPDNDKTYSCAIVLGGFSSIDAHENGYFNEASPRFIEGIKLLSMGKATHIMITGGNGNLVQGTLREAKWTKKQLEELRYPDSCMLIESSSRNTIENAVFSKPILEKSGLKPPYILVTSDFHMRRAAMIFRHEGYNVILDPVRSGDSAGFSFADLIPDAETLSAWTIYLKEGVGYVVNYYKTKP